MTDPIHSDNYKFGAETDSIGLALSGGGHRATIFALGALIYLFDVDANRAIRAVSSVSGGSILNGYLGLLEKPLGEMSQAEFDIVASRLARKVAGNPERWRRSILLLIANTAIFVVGVSTGSIWALAIWLGATILISLFASGAGGSLWGWWGTWAYVTILLAVTSATLVAFAWSLLWLDPIALLVTIVLAYLSGYILRKRGEITSLALGASICELARRGASSASLTSLRQELQHVICATEMHGGRHCYFTQGFVYAPAIGVGHAENVTVRSAIQASASFPGAFPFRRIRTALLKFCVWDMLKAIGGPEPALVNGQVGNIDKIEGLPKALLLTDGGVNDNLGLSWFNGAERSGKHIDRWVIEMSNNCSMLTRGDHKEYPALKASIELGMRASTSMRSHPDVTIALNAGAPRRWNAGVSSWFSSFLELAELYGSTIAMYNELQEQTMRRFALRLDSRTAKGAIVELGEVGVRRGSYADPITALERKWNKFLESLPEPRDMITNLINLSERNARVATTLNPLGNQTTVALLYHGYLQTMVCLHVELGFKLLDMPPAQRFWDLVGARPTLETSVLLR